MDGELLSRRTTMVVGVAFFLAYICFRFHAFEVENSWYGIIFKVKSLRLESRTKQTPTARFCLKLPGVKWSAQTREHFVGSNDSLLSFTSHSFRSFRLSGNLNVLTLDLEFFMQFIAAQNNIIFR